MLERFRPERISNALRKRTVNLLVSLRISYKLLYRYKILSAQDLCLPDFLIIGVPRAGTTWLKKNMDKHPELFLPEISAHDPTEIRYFNHKLNKSLKWYSSLFLPGKDKVKGEKTPGYCSISLQRIRLIYSIMPKVKLILILRNPIERDWSHAIMNLARFNKNEFKDIKDDHFFNHFERKKKLSNYINIIENWSAVFPKEQIFIGFYNDIMDNPQGLLKRIFNFLEVNVELDWTEFPLKQEVNRNPKIQMSDNIKSHLVSKHSKDIKKLSETFGSPVDKWLKI